MGFECTCVFECVWTCQLIDSLQKFYIFWRRKKNPVCLSNIIWKIVLREWEFEKEGGGNGVYSISNIYIHPHGMPSYSSILFVENKPLKSYRKDLQQHVFSSSSSSSPPSLFAIWYGNSIVDSRYLVAQTHAHIYKWDTKVNMEYSGTCLVRLNGLALCFEFRIHSTLT